jgi:hypothetical protein
MLRRGRLPTFLIIGAMKAGTTSLHSYLQRHPQVCMSLDKELKFFVANRNWDRGLSWYRSQFPSARHHVAIGESSPHYAMLPGFPGVPERIKRTIPDVRLVYLVREPIERLQSHYLHDLAAGKHDLDIGEALRGRFGYTAASRYAMQLDAYLEHFPPEQILVVTSDDLRDRREATVTRVVEFIGADSSIVPDNLGAELHQTSGKPVDRSRATIDPDLRDGLRTLFTPEVAPLRRWLGPAFDGWGLLDAGPAG